MEAPQVSHFMLEEWVSLLVLPFLTLWTVTKQMSLKKMRHRSVSFRYQLSFCCCFEAQHCTGSTVTDFMSKFWQTSHPAEVKLCFDQISLWVLEQCHFSTLCYAQFQRQMNGLCRTWNFHGFGKNFTNYIHVLNCHFEILIYIFWLVHEKQFQGQLLWRNTG